MICGPAIIERSKLQNFEIGAWILELGSWSFYLAFMRTSGPVTLQVLPFASVPLKVDCAVCADADTLHHLVRMVVVPLAAILKFGFVAEPAAPSNVSTRLVTVTATPPVSLRT